MLLPALDTNSNIDLFLFIPCEKLCTCAPCVHGDHLCKKSYSLNHKQWILHGQTVSDIDRRREYEKAFKAHLDFSYSNHSWPSIRSTSLWHFDGFIELLVQYLDQLVQYLALTFQSTQIYCFNLDQSSRGQSGHISTSFDIATLLSLLSTAFKRRHFVGRSKTTKLLCKQATRVAAKDIIGLHIFQWFTFHCLLFTEQSGAKNQQHSCQTSSEDKTKTR